MYVVADLLGKGQKDAQVKQKVLQQILEMAFEKQEPAKKEQRKMKSEDLTWNLPR